MACDVQALCNESSTLIQLGDNCARLVQIGALINWASATNPSLEFTPSAIMQRAAENKFTALSEPGLRMVIYSLLCNIRG